MTESFAVTGATWREDREDLLAVRREVFVVEQRVPEEIEVDDEDEAALHVIARDGAGTPIGTARLLEDGHIGRVAVLREWRGHGVGSALMERLLEVAREAGLTGIPIHAQVSSIPFYERLGFVVHGDEFEEAGIPHRHMRLEL